ncbi:Proteasome assembly chaperone 2 [Lobosporangium transversale]|uniref:Proteasome assembly chaperone 2 n=1 Tax=Lobosporangium transversale TaxID=64571 RepID=A0A1Y2H2N4_9FUNG|nr:PAC2 family-domain-containing protein [Lobosporangium transversale]KAF9904822.1 Proteasome assembly chaperone 2 [Lobosporangium transversale]ORZ28241.1 PAC2 family-domain-containing protein [Lobosporangium transversale]|eukprot:XP_021885926.1 PAC2 family-domain-containing protein [Lobosporangium transversale]
MNTFVASPGFDVSRLKGTTLILPSVSIGNVPQLTIDLLLATLKLDRVGCIEDENVVPVLGPADSVLDPMTPSTIRKNNNVAAPAATRAEATGPALALAVEVFQSKDGKWTLIQQRSPTVHHRSHHYTDNLIQFIKESGFGQVVLLTSADGARRIDIQLQAGTPPVRFISSPKLSKELVEETIQGQLGIVPLEDVPATEDQKREAIIRRQEHFLAMHHHQASSSAALTEQVEEMQLDETQPEQQQQQQQLEKVPRIPSGGIARRLHSLCQEQDIAILTLIKFAMEGDNAPDAIFLANVLNAIFKLHSSTEQEALQGEGSWKVPKSWDSLYGNSFHQDMYH